MAEQIRAYLTPIIIEEQEENELYLKVVHFKQARITHETIVTIDFGCWGGECDAKSIKNNFLKNPKLLGAEKLGRKSYIGQYQCTDADFTFRYQGKTE